jgi:peptidoglycan/xylan/chitin deacetylase (PgdA/CDA1 family)
MNLRVLTRFRSNLRKLWPRPRPFALILLYHRIASPPTDPQLLSVTPERFASQMRHVSRHYDVVSLEQLVSRMRQGRLSSRLIAVTFDDGYNDNLLTAKPILESCQVPATVFVSTGYLDNQSVCWWDELEQLFLHPSVLPGSLQLTVDGRLFEWTLGGDARYRQEDFMSHRTWNVLRRDDPTNRQRVYRALCRLLRPLDEQARQEALHQLRVWASAGREHPCGHRMLTREEVRHLAEGQYVKVGAHTESHPVLARLPLAYQREEIGSSKKALEDILGHAVDAFAYPYGTRSDYTRDTTELVKEAGFSFACSNFPETVSARSDLYQLPRFVVRDWEEARFVRSLTSWWEGDAGEEGCDH